MENIVWIDPNTALVNGGGPVEFVGVIRGQGHPVIRYIGPSLPAVTDGLILEGWIYVIRYKGQTVFTSYKKRPA